MSYRVLDPVKLKIKRGELSMDAVVAKSDNAFAKATYSGWENNYWKPRPEQIPTLLKALETTWEEISSPIEELASCQ